VSTTAQTGWNQSEKYAVRGEANRREEMGVEGCGCVGVREEEMRMLDVVNLVVVTRFRLGR
jgi:hypothetical protein